MKKSILILFLSVLAARSYSQITYANGFFSVSTFGGNRHLYIPLTSDPNQSSGTNPGTSRDTSCSFLLEFGNGYFTTDTNTPYTFATAPSKPSVLSLAGRYDTIKPPPVFASRISQPETGTATVRPSLLTGHESIKISSIADNLNARDEMLYVITYKVPVNARCARVIFFYNRKNIDNVYHPLLQSPNLPNINGETTPISRVRTYFEESDLKYDIEAASPGNFLSHLIGEREYNNSISFQWNRNVGDPYKEQNAFITLRTLDNLPLDSTATVEAILVYNKEEDGSPVADGSGTDVRGKDDTGCSEFESGDVYQDLKLVSANPHDPNYIKVVPHCILTGPSGTNKSVMYNIHFQNEGAGRAGKIAIEVTFDKKLVAALDGLKQEKIYVSTKNAENFTIDSLTRPSRDKIRIVIFHRDMAKKGQNNINLEGNNVPFAPINKLTMGNISFSLDVPVDKEDDFTARAAIYFYNTNNDPMPAVETKTDTLFVRKACHNLLYPHIPPIKRGCNTFLGMCWYWWIPIILCGGVLIWFIVWRRKKEKKEKINY